MSGSILESLNPAQQEAGRTIAGPILILAGPGSGKTRVLTHRIAYMLGEAQPSISPYNILAVTFTNKAAKEMKERLGKLLLEHFGEQSEIGKYLTVGTFHAVCVRILRREIQHLGLDRSFAIYDDGDQLQIIKNAMAALNMNDKQCNPRAVLSAISSAKSTLLSPKGLQEQAKSYFEELASRIYEKYQELLRLNHALDFDDLINMTTRLFAEAPQVLDEYQERYKYIMVDEYQDTNQAQYQLIKSLASKYQNICVVGDVNQSIYSFRSADIRNILMFEDDYPEAKVISLEQNYRSTQVILDAAQNLIRSNNQRRDLKLWTENGTGTAIQAYEAYDEMQEADYVVGEVNRTRARTTRPYRDFAVLYRTNAQSRAIEEMCIRRNLPYQLIGGTRFYERREIKDVLAYLRLIQNPYDGLSFLRIMNNTPTGKGVGSKSLTDLMTWADELNLPVYPALQLLQSEEADALSHHNRGELEPFESQIPPLNVIAKAKGTFFEFINLLDAFIKARNEMPLPELFDFVLKKSGYEEALRDGSEDGDERWRNVQELRGVTGDFTHLSGEEGLTAFLEQVALVAEVDKLDPDKDAITLITLHAAKGLEFPYVFIVGMEENILPHSRSLDSEKDIEEERRLLYVGITRAKEKLYLVYATRRSLWGNQLPTKPSRFLKELPSHLLKGLEQNSGSGGGHSGLKGSQRPTTWGGTGNKSTTWDNNRNAGATNRTAPIIKAGIESKPAAASGKTPNAVSQFKAGDKV
ncbi:MAG: UvrD-helicase domain-containing protein, partial [Chloroflexota bacterium]